jgi:hypothetical protein
MSSVPINTNINIKDVMPSKVEETKCGPHINFENGSCISLELLIDMAKAYNKYCIENKKNQDIIPLNNTMNTLEPSKYKIHLLYNFKKRFSGSQKNWIKQEFMSLMSKDNRYELENNTFRPMGPSGQFEWLSTLDINKTLAQYESKYHDFKFLGAVPIDFNDLDYYPFKKMNFKEFQENNINRIGVIYNLDKHNQGGSHWVSLFADLKNKQIYFSDSYGTRPPQEVKDFMNRIKNYIVSNGHSEKDIDIRHNPTPHQRGNSECGVYSINFILRLLKGKGFDHITRKRLDDKKVNKCRNIYFEKTHIIN